MSLSFLLLFFLPPFIGQIQVFQHRALHNFVPTIYSFVVKSLTFDLVVSWQNLQAPILFMPHATVSYTACSGNGSSHPTTTYLSALIPTPFRCTSKHFGNPVLAYSFHFAVTPSCHVVRLVTSIIAFGMFLLL